MKIGFIGAGNIGGTLARLFTKKGHQVAVSNSRGPETLGELAGELGDNGQAVTADEAASFGEVVVVSIPFGRYREVPAALLEGKIVIDTNNYYAQRDGRFAELDDDSATSSGLLQDHLPAAHVVKAFNAIYWERLRDEGRDDGGDDRVGIPISGDDAAAKQLVTDLIDQIGFAAVDVGDLSEGGRKHQPGTPVYGAPLTGRQLREQLG